MKLYRLPIRIESVANLREHWTVKHKRNQAHRKAAIVIPKGLPLPAIVYMTRIAPRALDDDNLVSAFKALRDGIAARFGLPDNHPDLTWHCAQRRGTPREYAAEVVIRQRDE